jgi:uncharacterized protein YjbJ (UPF0337 family)
MNNDISVGQWKEMRGRLRSWWGKLTDDDFEWIGGQKDKLIGVMQERYGYTRDQAEHEIDRRFTEYEGSSAGLQDKAYDLGSTAMNKAREATAGLTSGLERATSYAREMRFEDIASDLGALIRRYPVQSILLGFAMLYLLSRGRNRY